MYLLAPIQNQYPMLFLSECFPHRSLISSSQHSAKSAHDMKIRLVRLASQLRGIPDRSATREAATPKEGRRRVRLTLDPQTQHALDGLSVTPSNAVNTHINAVNTHKRRQHPHSPAGGEAGRLQLEARAAGRRLLPPRSAV